MIILLLHNYDLSDHVSSYNKTVSQGYSKLTDEEKEELKKSSTTSIKITKTKIAHRVAKIAKRIKELVRN